MGKRPIKTYWSWDRRIRIDVFENTNAKKKKYNIFKLFFYIYSRPIPIALKKNEVYALQEVLSNIKIQGYDEESKKIEIKPKRKKYD